MRRRFVRVWRDQRAQGTVEYLIVALVFIVIFVGMSLLTGQLRQGTFSEHAANSASHAFAPSSAGSTGDVLLY